MATLLRNSKRENLKRKIESESESGISDDEIIESEQEIEETPEEKRLRLAQIYLEELQRKENEQNENHDEINDKLRQKELEANQKIVKFVADKYRNVAEISFHKDKIHKLPLTALVIYESKFIFTASKDSSIVKWTFEDGKPKWNLRKKKGEKGHKSIINAMAVNHDGTFLATGDDSKMVFIWKCDTLDFVKCFQGHRGAVTGLAFARGKNVLYSCSKDRSVKTWDLDQMGYVETL